MDPSPHTTLDMALHRLVRFETQMSFVMRQLPRSVLRAILIALLLFSRLVHLHPLPLDFLGSRAILLLARLAAPIQLNHTALRRLLRVGMVVVIVC